MTPPPDPAAVLAELKPMLALFAQAVAGSAVALRELGMPEPRAQASGTPTAIVLPARIDCFASVRENRGAYRIAVLRQALAAHDDESLHAASAVASTSWRRIFRALECLRVDAALARRYAGARADLARQRAHELALRRATAPRRRPLMRAIESLRRHALGDAAATDDAATLAMLCLAAGLERGGIGALDSARAATRICASLGVPAIARRRAHELTARGAMPAAFTAPPGETAADRAVQAAAGDDGGEPVSSGANAGRTAAIARRPAQRSAAAIVARDAAAKLRSRAGDDGPPTATAAPSDDGAPGRTFTIDEWDYREQRLLPDWCTLVERRQHGSDIAFIHRVRRRHAALARRVHGQFAAWRPEGLQRVHGASDGDEVEFDRVVQALVDRRAGVLDDAAWYVRRDRAQRDVATAFLVDTSASTDFVLPDATVVGPPRPAPSTHADAVYLYDLALSAPPPAAPQRRVIDVAKDALALMCDALHTLGDCFAVYTFSGHGRARVDFRVVKSFDEAVSSRTAGAIASLKPHGATRTGAAIRHATAQLLRQGQRQRALIVVTDGYPEDVDYGPTPRDLRYGLEDTAHALQEAQAVGVQTFCLSIDPAGHDYLRRMCPPRRYLVIGELDALPDELAKVYRGMTRPTLGAA